MKPSIKTLEAAFPGHGKVLRKIIDAEAITAKGVDMTGLLPKTAAWVCSCFNYPAEVEIQLRAASELLEAYGTEAIFGDRITQPDLEYVNMGDTYNTTIVYDYIKDRFMVTTVGYWIERQERNGTHYE